MQFLVTGVAGFIGSRVALSLLESGHSVVGLDNLNDYYSVAFKQARLQQLKAYETFRFEKMDLADHEALLALPERDEIDRVIHLAAQAGVRYSLENPFAYAASNLTGHLAILEFCRRAAKAPLLAYASSSSVYGDGAKAPFREDSEVNKPVSLYAATKRADELMSLTYAKLYGIEQIGMRFFTVYGPWGRPDMAYWSFTDRILRGETIRVFNGGQMKRDFTYIDDIVSGTLAALDRPPTAAQSAPHKVYNLGNHEPVNLLDYIAVIERACQKKALLEMQPMQAGDVLETYADITDSCRDLDFQPSTSIEEGIPQFVDWYKSYFDV